MAWEAQRVQPQDVKREDVTKETAMLTGKAFAAIHESLSMLFTRLDEQQQEIKRMREVLERAGLRF